MTERAEDDPFRHDAQWYDALIDWQRRLAHETPFYQRLFQQVGVRRVLDVACGTGHHAALFHSWGLEVEGADISPAMLARCRSLHGEAEKLRWVERSFEQPAEPGGTFDAVICVGNSLAVAADQAAVGRVVANMLAALRPGGVCVIQVLNLWRLPEGPVTWQKCKRVRIDGSDRILLKGVHRVGRRGFVEIAELKLGDQELESDFSRATLLSFEAEDFAEAVQTGGGRYPQFFGGYQDEPYDRSASQDLIVVARRR